MKTLKCNKLIKFVSTGIIAFTALMVANLASAGTYATKNYGTHWAFVNGWGGGNFGYTWGTGSTANMTTTWNYNYSSPSTLWGYPAIVRGWHYGTNPAGDTLFPKQVSKITTANCSFSYTTGGTGLKGDMAYDMFFRKDNSKSTPQLEVMVWGKHNTYPIGSLSKSKALTVSGVTYDLWEGMNSSAGYYVFTFVPTNTVGVVTTFPTGSGSVNVNMKTFFNYLATNKSANFNNNLYLDVIEAGMEVGLGVNAWAWIQGSFGA